jgi:uncharacterized protein DUF4386
MTNAKSAGRAVAALLLAQMIVSPIVNFALLQPIFRPPGFLEQAPTHATAIAIAAMLGIGTGVLSVAIAITAWPVLRKHGEAVALCLFAAGVAALVAHVVEQSHLLSMLTLAKTSAAANGADAEVFRRIAAQAGAARYTAHLVGLAVDGALALVLYGASFRFALVPRWLAGAGIVAALLEMSSVSLPFFGQDIVFALLAPLGLCHLALIVWLFARGFAEHPPAPAA